MRHRRAVRTLPAALAVLALAGCGTSMPELTAEDLPSDYGLVEDQPRTPLTDCRTEAVVDRHGEVVASRTFERRADRALLTYTVLRDDDGQLFAGLVDAVRGCPPTVKTLTDDTGELTAVTLTITLTQGPEVGEDSAWFESETGIGPVFGVVLDSDDPPLRGVIARSGNYVLVLSPGLGLDDQEIVALVNAALT